MEPLEQSVLVGVTGREENTDALRFAAREAERLGLGLTLVHAVHPMLPPPPPSAMMADGSWSDVGNAIVREVRDEVDEITSGAVPVATEVRHGAPAAVFAELSESAPLVVLQHRDLSRLHRIVTGSTVVSVAAHARSPVVSVQPTESPASPTGMITCGVHGDGGPAQVLATAFAQAAARGASLRVVHAWRMEGAYDDITAADTGWVARAEERITAAMADLRAKHPDVDVEVDVRHAWPADGLAKATQGSDMLVVGRHSGMPALPARLGHLARAMVTHAGCTVMIVPL
jgi:nucleotide-binding universal stress UspA family protein